MAAETNSEIVKKYGFNAGASVVGIAASKDFGLAPAGLKPAGVLPECFPVIALGAPSPPEVLDEIAEYTSSRNAMFYSRDWASG